MPVLLNTPKICNRALKCSKFEQFDAFAISLRTAMLFVEFPSTLLCVCVFNPPCTLHLRCTGAAIWHVNECSQIFFSFNSVERMMFRCLSISNAPYHLTHLHYIGLLTPHQTDILGDLGTEKSPFLLPSELCISRRCPIIWLEDREID